jgi:hypothetical protein
LISSLSRQQGRVLFVATFYFISFLIASSSISDLGKNQKNRRLVVIHPKQQQQQKEGIKMNKIHTGEMSNQTHKSLNLRGKRFYSVILCKF